MSPKDMALAFKGKQKASAVYTADMMFDHLMKHLANEQTSDIFSGAAKTTSLLEAAMCKHKDLVADIIVASKCCPLKSSFVTAWLKYAGERKWACNVIWAREQAYVLKQFCIVLAKKARNMINGAKYGPSMIYLVNIAGNQLGLSHYRSTKRQQSPSSPRRSSGNFQTPVRTRSRSTYSPAPSGSSPPVTNRLNGKTSVARAIRFDNTSPVNQATSVNGAGLQLALWSPVVEYKYFWDSSENTIVRSDESGIMEKAKVTKDGESGFLVGVFQDGYEWQSEEPNISRFLGSAQDLRDAAQKAVKDKAAAKALKAAQQALKKAISGDIAQNKKGEQDKRETDKKTKTSKNEQNKKGEQDNPNEKDKKTKTSKGAHDKKGKQDKKDEPNGNNKKRARSPSKNVVIATSKPSAKIRKVVKEPLAIVAVDEPIQKEEPTQDYLTMYYANTHRMAIRERCHKKRQLFQFGCASMSRQDLEDIGKEAISNIKCGDMTIEAARKHCKDKMS